MSYVDNAKRRVGTINLAISYLNDSQSESATELFPEWAVGEYYSVGIKRRYENLLYKCVQAHTSQIDWAPPNVPALWVRTSTDPWPEWIQPTGAHDAYAKGAKVIHNSTKWISDVDNNVWEPGVYGWTVVQSEE